MKMLAIVLISVLTISAQAEQTPLSYSMTNVMSWVGVNINASNVSNLPHRVSSTPGDAFLGFLRTFITGDLDAYLFHMSPLRRNRHIGTDNLALIPQNYRTRYSMLNFNTNLCIKSFSSSFTATNVVSINCLLEETSVDESEEASFEYVIVFTNGEWKIGCNLSGDD